MWIWIRGRKTFSLGLFIFMIALSVCLYALIKLWGISPDPVVDPTGFAAYLFQVDNDYLKTLRAGLAGTLIGGAMALSPRLLTRLRPYNVAGNYRQWIWADSAFDIADEVR